MLGWHFHQRLPITGFGERLRGITGDGFGSPARTSRMFSSDQDDLSLPRRSFEYASSLRGVRCCILARVSIRN